MDRDPHRVEAGTTLGDMRASMSEDRFYRRAPRADLPKEVDSTGFFWNETPGPIAKRLSGSPRSQGL